MTRRRINSLYWPRFRPGVPAPVGDRQYARSGLSKWQGKAPRRFATGFAVECDEKFRDVRANCRIGVRKLSTQNRFVERNVSIRSETLLNSVLLIWIFRFYFSLKSLLYIRSLFHSFSLLISALRHPLLRENKSAKFKNNCDKLRSGDIKVFIHATVTALVAVSK